jgi:hypothetical protein
MRRREFIAGLATVGVLDLNIIVLALRAGGLD